MNHHTTAAFIVLGLELQDVALGGPDMVAQVTYATSYADYADALYLAADRIGSTSRSHTYEVALSFGLWLVERNSIDGVMPAADECRHHLRELTLRLFVDDCYSVAALAARLNEVSPWQ